MIRSTRYPYQSYKNTPTKRQQLHQQINDLILDNFSSFEYEMDAETVWLAMKAKGIELSISTFYNRLKELVEANLIEKKPNGYNKFVYRNLRTLTPDFTHKNSI
jgi:Fe2+ or Zn2+ uptake regulation protein